jgi:hypothetical protein
MAWSIRELLDDLARFVLHLVWVPQRSAKESLATRLQCNDVLARGEHDLADGDHTLLADGFADHSKRLLADLAIGAM